jgi:hypothetical protein
MGKLQRARERWLGVHDEDYAHGDAALNHLDRCAAEYIAALERRVQELDMSTKQGMG